MKDHPGKGGIRRGGQQAVDRGNGEVIRYAVRSPTKSPRSGSTIRPAASSRKVEPERYKNGRHESRGPRNTRQVTSVRNDQA
jgi:hypothetical protein